MPNECPPADDNARHGTLPSNAQTETGHVHIRHCTGRIKSNENVAHLERIYF